MRAALSGFVMVVGCLFSSILHADDTATRTGETNVEFAWALAALQGTGSETEILALDKDATLQAGSEVGLLVSPVRPCFIYVLARRSDGELKLVFPSRLPHPESAADSGRRSTSHPSPDRSARRISSAG